ncbi:hypothetical protein HRbin14_02124 [bacterium HR14]|nr:hypothetical protein HRbin14_02124 [bacterium HR14]
MDSAHDANRIPSLCPLEGFAQAQSAPRSNHPFTRMQGRQADKQQPQRRNSCGSTTGHRGLIPRQHTLTPNPSRGRPHCQHAGNHHQRVPQPRPGHHAELGNLARSHKRWHERLHHRAEGRLRVQIQPELPQPVIQIRREHHQHRQHRQNQHHLKPARTPHKDRRQQRQSNQAQTGDGNLALKRRRFAQWAHPDIMVQPIHFANIALGARNMNVNIQPFGVLGRDNLNPPVGKENRCHYQQRRQQQHHFIQALSGAIKNLCSGHFHHLQRKKWGGGVLPPAPMRGLTAPPTGTPSSPGGGRSRTRCSRRDRLPLYPPRIEP